MYYGTYRFIRMIIKIITVAILIGFVLYRKYA